MNLGFALPNLRDGNPLSLAEFLQFCPPNAANLLEYALREFRISAKAANLTQYKLLQLCRGHSFRWAGIRSS